MWSEASVGWGAMRGWAVATLLLAAVGRAPAAVEVACDGTLVVDGTRVFPLEIYRASSSEAMEDVGHAGFNTVVVGSREAVERAAEHGLYSVVSAGYHGDERIDWGRIRQCVESVMDQPGVLGYVLIDEPDLRDNVASPSGLDRVAAFVRGVDPTRPVMVTCSGINGVWRVPAYQSAVDVLRADPYPVHYGRPLTWAAEVLDLLRWSAPSGSSRWLILQAWKGPDTPIPTAEQDRTLTYLALVHGARGISHYAYAFSDRGPAERVADSYPALWRTMCDVAAELSALHDDLAAPSPPVGLHVATSGARVDAEVFGTVPDLLVIAVNPSDVATTARFTLTADVAREVVLPFEGRVLPRVGSSFEDAFGPGEEHVYRVRLAEDVPEAVCLVPPSPHSRRVEYPSATLLGGEPAAVTVELVGEAGHRSYGETHVGTGARRVPLHLPGEAWRIWQDECLRLSMEAGGLSYAVAVPGRRGEVVAEIDAVSLTLSAERQVASGDVLDVVAEVSGDVGARFSLQLRGSSDAGAAWMSPLGAAGAQRFVGEVLVPQRFDFDYLWLLADLQWRGEGGRPMRLLAPLEVRVRRTFEARLVAEDLWVEPGGTAGGYVHLSSEGSASFAPPPEWSIEPAAREGVGELHFTLSPPQTTVPMRSRMTCTCSDGETVAHLGADCVLPVWAPMAERPVEFDGLLSEWDLSHPVEPSRESPEPRGVDQADPAAVAWMMWDEAMLYIAVRATDHEHVDGFSGIHVWRNDSVQLSIDAGVRPLSIKGPFSDGHSAFGFAISGGEPVVGGWFTPAGVSLADAVGSLGFGAIREGDEVTYEIGVPWSCMGLARAARRGGLFVSLLLNDWDPTSGDPSRNWLELGGGIVYGCEPTQYMPVAPLDPRGRLLPPHTAD